MRPAAGLFLRRRERAASEYRRRNIFELYIEEVVEACNRLKGGKLSTEKLKSQLQKIAATKTGGIKTDETLGKTGDGPEGLPHSIIVTHEGIDGDVPPALVESNSVMSADTVPDEMQGEVQQPSSKPGRKQTAKVIGGRNSKGKAIAVSASPAKGTSAHRQTGTARKRRKAHRAGKKK